MAGKRTTIVLHNFKNFGFSFGMSFLLSKTAFRKEEYKTRIKAINLLEKELSQLTEKYKEKDTSGCLKAEGQKNIFMFWWDGFCNAPKLVKNNVLEIQKFYPDYHLHLIDKKNCSEYVSFLKEITDYFHSGNISIQTLSDILRMSLLSKYGGFWMDATVRVFQREPLLDQIKRSGFYSLNIECKEKSALWSKVIPDLKYVTFYMGAEKGNPAISFVRDAFEEYYKRHDYLIDYFLVDYLLAIAKKNGLGRSCLDSPDFRKGNPFYLSNCLDEGKVPSLCKCKECPQKLNWRSPYINSDFIFR